ncbi:MAG TPA: porin family protein [Segetibacter sp.]
MKKILLVVAATVVATVSFSQVRVGIQAIGNAGSASIETTDIENVKKPMQIGVGAGLAADFSISDHFSIKPSLNFLQKKSRFEYENPEIEGKIFSVNTTLNYVELPVNFVYKIPTQSATVYFGAGPSLGYGISGKMVAKGWEIEGNQPVAVNESLDAFKKEDKGGAGLKRLDVSANALAGIEFKNGLYVNAGYMMGLSNLIKEDKYKNRGLQLTVGFMFPSVKG